MFCPNNPQNDRVPSICVSICENEKTKRNLERKNCVSPSEKKRFPGEFSFHVWNRVTKKSGEKCLLAGNVFRLALMCSTHSKWMSQVEFLKKEKNVFSLSFTWKEKKEIPLKIYFSDTKIFTVMHSPQKSVLHEKNETFPLKKCLSQFHTCKKKKKYIFSLWKYFFIRFHAWKEMSWNIVLYFFSWVCHDKKNKTTFL